MWQLLTDIGLIISLLILLNLAAFFFFKNNPRLIRGPVFVFLFLMAGFFIYQQVIYPALNNQMEKERQKVLAPLGHSGPNVVQTDPDVAFTDRLIKNKQISLAIFHLAGWQVFLVFVLSALGLAFTKEKKTYLPYTLFFFLLSAGVFYRLFIS